MREVAEVLGLEQAAAQAVARRHTMLVRAPSRAPDPRACAALTRTRARAGWHPRNTARRERRERRRRAGRSSLVSCSDACLTVLRDALPCSQLTFAPGDVRKRAEVLAALLPVQRGKLMKGACDAGAGMGT